MAIVGIGVVGLGLYIAFDALRTGVGNRRAEKALAENVANAEPFVPKKTRIATWINRIEAMGESKKEGYNPFDDHHYQQTYAKIAVAKGGLFGKGSGKSTQRNFLPQPFSDCIYAIIIEEYGLIGGIFVMLLYIILFTRTIKIMRDRPLTFGALLSFGIALIIVVQAMINMGVSTGLMPITGQQLPFISKGGSSMLMTGFAIGMILSVSRHEEEVEQLEMEAV